MRRVYYRVFWTSEVTGIYMDMIMNNGVPENKTPTEIIKGQLEFSNSRGSVIYCYQVLKLVKD